MNFHIFDAQNVEFAVSALLLFALVIVCMINVSDRKKWRSDNAAHQGTIDDMERTIVAERKVRAEMAGYWNNKLEGLSAHAKHLGEMNALLSGILVRVYPCSRLFVSNPTTLERHLRKLKQPKPRKRKSKQLETDVANLTPGLAR